MAKRQKHRNQANPEYIQAMMGLRSSSAAQRHVPKHRKGSRKANKARAIREFA